MRIWARLTSRRPTTTSTAASAASGIASSSPAQNSTTSAIHTPCRTVEARLRAPAATLAELRTMTPVTGRPPSRPETVLAAPWATSSRSSRARGPSCIRSTATAESSDSTLATRAIVTTARAISAAGASGQRGRISSASGASGSSTRATSAPVAAATRVAASTATSAAGSSDTRTSRGQASSSTTVSRPISSEAPWWPDTWAGRSRRLRQADALRVAAEQHVHLAERDDQADPGEHAVHHGGREGERGATEAGRAEGDLDQAGQRHHGGGAGQAERRDGAGHDHGETGGRAADLQWRAAERARHDAADDRGDQPGQQRGTGRRRDPERERDRDEEHHDRCRQVTP